MSRRAKKPPPPSESSSYSESESPSVSEGASFSSSASSEPPKRKPKAKAKIQALREAQAKMKERMAKAMNKKMDQAATKVQSVWRGRAVRNQMADFKAEQEAQEKIRREEAQKRTQKIKYQKEYAAEKKRNEQERRERKERELKAAVMIQKNWRASAARRMVKNILLKKRREEAEKKRKYVDDQKRRRFQIQEKERRKRENAAAIKIQSAWRGYQARKQYKLELKWALERREMKRDKWERQHAKTMIEQKLQNMQAKRTVVGKYSRAGPVITGNERPTPSPRRVTGNGILTNEQWVDRQTSLAELDRKLKDLEDRRMGSRARHIAQAEAARWEQGAGMQRFHGWRNAESRAMAGMAPRNRAQLDSMLGHNSVANLEVRQRPMAGMEAFARGGQSPTVADIYRGRESPRNEHGYSAFLPPARDFSVGGASSRISRTPPPDFGRSRDRGWLGAAEVPPGGSSGFESFSGAGSGLGGGGTAVYGGGGGGGAGGGGGGHGSHAGYSALETGSWNRNHSPNFGVENEAGSSPTLAVARNGAVPSFGSVHHGGALSHSRSAGGLDAAGFDEGGALPRSHRSGADARSKTGGAGGAGGMDMSQRPWESWQPPSGTSARSSARAALKQAVADLEKNLASRSAR